MPPDSIHVRSGLLTARARNVIALPILYEGQAKAVIEPRLVARVHRLAAGVPRTAPAGSIGVVLNTIEATMRTEGLLKQSQQTRG